jgi:FkbM family methyltransferase
LTQEFEAVAVVMDRSEISAMLVNARYGQMIVVDSDPLASRSLELYGEWAQNELDILRRFLSPGMTVIDGGAYVGSHTLAFADGVGPTGNVHAFEAYPAFFDILSQNVRASRYANVVCHPDALSDQDGDACVPKIAMDVTANFGGSSFLEASQARSGGTGDIRIHFRPLDSLMREPVDFIKLDIEGMECLALRGAERILRQHKPVVFTECNSVDDGVATLLLMRQFGYVAFGCLTAAFNPQNFNAHQTNMFGDAKESGLIFIHDSRVAAFAEVLESLPLPRLERFDDLALLLNHKPQYPSEILAGSNTGRVFGLDYPSPLAAKLRYHERRSAELDAISDRLSERDAQLSQTNAQLSQATTQLSQATTQLSQMHAQLSETNVALAQTQALATERAKEIEHLSQRLDTTQAALVETQTLAVERYGQIEDLAARLADEEAKFIQQSAALNFTRVLWRRIRRWDR